MKPLLIASRIECLLCKRFLWLLSVKWQQNAFTNRFLISLTYLTQPRCRLTVVERQLPWLRATRPGCWRRFELVRLIGVRLVVRNRPAGCMTSRSTNRSLVSDFYFITLCILVFLDWTWFNVICCFMAMSYFHLCIYVCHVLLNSIYLLTYLLTY